MIIEQAIEKAKQQLKSRVAERAPVEVAALPESEPVAIPFESYPDLGRVELDPAECERNRILLVEGAQNELALAEPAYRLLRSRVRHRIVASNWSCVGITSPGPGEGKTVTALNLALSMARERQRPIFLLDLDMRNPSVFKYIGAAPMVQISEYLSGGVQPQQILFTTSVDYLLVAGNRSPVEGASELLSARGLERLLAYIRQRFPGAIILIDLPPVTSTDEALQVAPSVDAMFLVVGEGVTRREALMRAQNMLSDVTVAGIILNRSVERQDSYYRGRY